MKIVSGGKWTNDGRWVVIGPFMGHFNVIVILFDPDNGDPWSDLFDCEKFVRKTQMASASGINITNKTQLKVLSDYPSIEIVQVRKLEYGTDWDYHFVVRIPSLNGWFEVYADGSMRQIHNWE
jgi:hypothetical protein